ncbi:MAG: trypsin-like peptidase domain-containing protein, partial [Alphaproteobacteria bacterium]|nr:trypsin-like peptidase domain-containing protein [Alphaproteobacteria bacterium]
MKALRTLAPLALVFSMAAAPAMAHNTPDLADVVETALPTVVFITPATPQRESGIGSGFVYDGGNGYIVTNNHVVEGMNGQATVSFYNQDSYSATVVGTDPLTDIAVLKVDTDVTLPTATMGNSTAMRLGSSVVAIGAPLGFTFTVTTGIISGKDRQLGAGPFDQYIQTDTAINPGNSGGPLFNYAGEVVGINTAIISPTGTYAGIGLAVPSNQAAWVVKQIIKDGEVRRGFFGLSVGVDANGKGVIVQ